ncbi:MAG: hypothetical protein WD689_05765 [Gaiellaceae bacterium]
MSDIASRFADALALENETERKLAVVGVIDQALRDLGIRPVVVGGVAVEFWTYGEYATADIDLVMPYLPAADDRLVELGFARKGRHWVLPGTEIFVEAPGSALGPREEAVEVEIGEGVSVFVQSAEDILVARLEEFVATGHRDAAEQGVLLLRASRLDRRRLERRVEEEGLEPVLVAIERLAERLEAGGSVESFELHDLAHELRRELR